MILKENDYKDKAIEGTAEQMCMAGRTAPKTRGVDLIVTAIAKDDSVKKITEQMEKIFERDKREAFKRNAESLKNCSCIVLIGTKLKTAGLNPCSLCGFKNCSECETKNGICVFNPIDLGIAASSALSIAADHRVDNRLMWTIGMAALELKIFEEDVKMVLGIPLSATGKNIFFDRK